MRVGIPIQDGKIFAHFGKAPAFLVVDMVGDRVTSRTEVVPPAGNGVLPGFLKEQGVTHVIANCIGEGAVEQFRSMGIQVIAGVKGTANEVLFRFATGLLKADPANCSPAHVEPA